MEEKKQTESVSYLWYLLIPAALIVGYFVWRSQRVDAQMKKVRQAKEDHRVLNAVADVADN
jgi:hypothetical protein